MGYGGGKAVMSIEMIEPVIVPDVFISGIGSFEDLGGGALRFTFFARQQVDGKIHNVVVAKFIITSDALPKAIWTACHAAGVKCFGAVPTGRVP